MKDNSCERAHFFKTRFDRNTSFGVTNFEGLKGNVGHAVFQEILKFGECQGPNTPPERIQNVIVNNIFNHRKLVDRVMLDLYDDIINLNEEQMGTINLDANKMCSDAFQFKKLYLDKQTIITGRNIEK